MIEVLIFRSDIPSPLFLCALVVALDYLCIHLVREVGTYQLGQSPAIQRSRAGRATA